ncbi:MAG: tyrosine-type recombinase/integrase [Sterolibacterium sp.]
MGRPRTKDRDLPKGFRCVDGRWYWRPTDEATREICQRLAPGRASISCGATKEEARQWWVKTVLPAMDKAWESTDAAGTLTELLALFEEREIPHLKSEAAREAYLRNCGVLKKEFGTRRYAKSETEAARGNCLRRMDMQRYLDDARATRPVAANKEIHMLHRVFRLASARWGLTEYNPCATVEYNQEIPRDTYINDTAYQAVYSVASPVLKCMMDIAQMTGARAGMIYDIRLADDAEEGLWIRPNKLKRGESKKSQIFEWTTDLKDTIDRAKEIRRHVQGGQGEVAVMPHAYLFLTRAGKPYTKESFKSLWVRALTKAKVQRGDFHFHDIRAKAGSDSDSDAGAQKLLNHTDPTTTKRVYRRRPVEATPLPAVPRKKAGE